MISETSLIDDAVGAFSTLPGIGKKSALRLVLHMLEQPPEYTDNFTQTLADLRAKIHPCKRCGNYTELEICHICSNLHRSEKLICVVESIRDLLAIEQTGHYRGTYHVLGGLISPLEGRGPGDLRIAHLLDRARTPETEELVMALSPTIEGDATTYYIAKQLSGADVKITQISRGVSFGGELEYTDELTLSRSIEGRISYTAYHQSTPDR